MTTDITFELDEVACTLSGMISPSHQLKFSRRRNQHQGGRVCLFCQIFQVGEMEPIHELVMHSGLRNFEITKRNWHLREYTKEISKACELGGEDEKNRMEDILNEIIRREDDLVIQADGGKEEATAYEMSDEERGEAMKLLQDPKLLYCAKLFLDDVIVGEANSKLLVYLLCCGRKSRSPPLSLILTGTTAAGKSFILSNVLRLVPTENRMELSRLSETALDHAQDVDFDEKILFISEASGFIVAAERVKTTTDGSSPGGAYVTEPDEVGRFVARMKKMRGIPMYLSTSAKILEDCETLNRFLISGVNLTQEQTRQILEKQAEGVAQPWVRARNEKKARVFQNAFSLLEKYDVAIPFAPALTQYFTDERVRSRRDQPKLFSLIAASALLFQYQRERIETPEGVFLVAEIQDLWNAHRIAGDSLMLSSESLQGGCYEFFLKMLEIFPEMVDECNAETKNMIIQRIRSAGLRNSKTAGYEYLGLLEDQGFLFSFRDGRTKKMYFAQDGWNSGDDEKRIVEMLAECQSDMLRPNHPTFRHSTGAEGGYTPLTVEVVDPISGDLIPLSVGLERGGIPPHTLWNGGMSGKTDSKGLKGHSADIPPRSGSGKDKVRHINPEGGEIVPEVIE